MGLQTWLHTQSMILYPWSPRDIPCCHGTEWWCWIWSQHGISTPGSSIRTMWMNEKRSGNNEWTCRLRIIHKSIISHSWSPMKLSVAMALNGSVACDPYMEYQFQAHQSFPWPHGWIKNNQLSMNGSTDLAQYTIHVFAALKPPWGSVLPWLWMLVLDMIPTRNVHSRLINHGQGPMDK